MMNDSDADSRKRILDMLASGRISVDAATDLLKAVGSAVPKTQEAIRPAKPRGGVRMLRIVVDAPATGGSSGAKVRVNIPLALAKYAARFLPSDASAELSSQGIDLAQLLKDLGDEVPDGRLVDIEAEDEKGGGTTTVVIEVV